MAQFSSDFERKKWASLQNSAGASLNNIVQGRAQAADFQRVSTVLNGLNSLAAQVFAEAVSAAEVQAKKFEAQYQNITYQRDLDTLTAYEKALNEALKSVAPDIVDQLKDVFALELLESNEELTRTIGGRFSDLADMLPPQDLPTTNDVLAANELLVEQLSATDDEKWKVRESSLVEKISDAFGSVLRNFAEMAKRDRDSRAYANPSPMGGGAVPRLGGPSPNWEVMDEAPLLSQARTMLGGPRAEIPAIEAFNAPTAGTGTVAGSATLAAGKEGPKIALSEHAESAITQAASDQSNLYKQLLAFLTGNGAGGAGAGGGSGGGQEQSKDDEEEKADTWWRSFRNMTGDMGKKYKDFKKDNAGWLGSLGSALTLMILDPKLFKSFGDMIEKYVTFDNIKKVVVGAWDWVSEQGKSVLDWVMDKLGIGGMAKTVGSKVSSAAHTVADKAKGAANWVEGKLGIGNSKAGAATKGGTSSSGTGVLSSVASGAKNVASGVASAVGSGASALINAKSSTGFASKYSGPAPHAGGSTNTSTTSVAGSTINVGGNRSSITNKPIADAGTQAVPANPAVMSPGATTAPPGAGNSGSLPSATNTQNIKGTPQVGVTSFGFHTGMDDSLNMMNTSYFTG